MTDKLVTIAQFSNYIEAELAKQLLEDYGIQATATGGNASNVFPIPAIEGPELKVLDSQAREARKILESHQKPEQ